MDDEQVFETLAPEYRRDMVEMVQDDPGAVERVVVSLLYKYKYAYDEILARTKVPLAFTLPIHYREREADQEKIEEDVIDLFVADIEKLGLDKVTRWTRERVLYEQEKMTDFEDRRRGRKSQYLYARTSLDPKGAYPLPDEVENRIGTAALMMAMFIIDRTTDLPTAPPLPAGFYILTPTSYVTPLPEDITSLEEQVVPPKEEPDPEQHEDDEDEEHEDDEDNGDENGEHDEASEGEPEPEPEPEEEGEPKPKPRKRARKRRRK